jgi:hypothetical protein
MATIADIGEKTCPTCKISYPRTSEFFNKDKNRKFGLGFYCRDCTREHSKKYKGKRDTRLMRLYGITEQEFNDMLVEQDYCCACCDKHMSESEKTMNVDHDHNVTGPEGIRGILCWSCNVGIGHLGDEIDGVEKALEYLKRYYN